MTENSLHNLNIQHLIEMNFVDIGLKPGLENREYGLGDPLN
jgi:hypothetical protein